MAQRRAPSKGFARTSSLLTQRIRKASESRGFAQSRLLTHWEEVVGEDVSSIARPVNVSFGRQGFGATLTLLTTGAQAPMLEMQKEQIRAKVNAVYGYNAIRSREKSRKLPRLVLQRGALYLIAQWPLENQSRPPKSKPPLRNQLAV